MKLYNVFIGKPRWEGGWPYIGFDNEALIKNTLEKLREKFPNIDFLGGEMIEKYDKNLIEKIKTNIKEVDGLIVYVIGQYGDEGPINAAIELIEQNIPTILVNYIFGGDTYFIRIYEKVKNLKVLPISSIDFEDLDWAINIIHGIYKLKGIKILNYTLDKDIRNPQGLKELLKYDIKEMNKEALEFFGKMEDFARASYIDLTGVDQAHQWRRDEEKYKKNLAEIFGIEMIRYDPKEILEEYNKVNENEAKEIANKWIKNAIRVSALTDVIINEAKLYLAIKNLMEKYKADAITIDCGTLLITGFLPAFPCLAMHELMNEGSKGGPESDMDSLISSLFCWYVTNRPAYTSNHCIDLKNNRVIYLHCCVPSKLYGPNGPAQKYEITRHGEGHFLGASILLDFPIGENVTTIKISVLDRKIAIRSGKILGTIRDERACLSKLLVETNAQKILENYDFKTFGWHRVTVLGDWKKEIIAAAKLLGLTIIEEDI
ncbi:MAG: hypothetical protein QXV60_00005 [Nitrososphaerota archaeon]